MAEISWADYKTKKVGKSICKTFYWDGIKSVFCKKFINSKGNWHRDNGPAYVEYYHPDICDGRGIAFEKYFNNGQKHRENGPAVICYNEDGLITSQEYWVNGRPFRDHGPVVVGYHFGLVCSEEYCFYNDEFGLTGILAIAYSKNGTIKNFSHEIKSNSMDVDEKNPRYTIDKSIQATRRIVDKIFMTLANCGDPIND